MQKTKELSNEEYDGLPFSLTDVIKNQVNKESLKWWAKEHKEVELPKCPKVKVKRDVVGWVVFFKSIFLSSVMQLRP